MSSDFVNYKNQLLGLLQGLNYRRYATDNEREQTIKHINYGLKKLSTLNIKEAIEERKLREEQEEISKRERELKEIDDERKRQVEKALEETRQRKEKFKRLQDEIKRQMKENEQMRNEEIDTILITKKQPLRRSRLIRNYIRTAKNRPSRERAVTLKSICPNTSYCLAFGMQTDLINKFFEFFKSLQYVKKATIINKKDTGENVSGNGEIILLEYKREQYDSYAIIKTPLENKSDSIIYEYLAGRYFINYFYKKFPCFVQTYGFFRMINKQKVRRNKLLNLLSLEEISQQEDKSESITEMNNLLTETCQDPRQFSLLIEYIPTTFKLEDVIRGRDNPNKSRFIREESLCILFQIYYALDQLRGVFTHYDLSYRNVLIYEPVPGEYIEYHYHYKGRVISFRSRYIAKIIDYGRCYFNNGIFSSLDIYRLVCSNAVCTKDIFSEKDNICGEKLGFHMFEPPDKFNGHFINSSRNHPSHDLLLLADIASYIFDLGIGTKDMQRKCVKIFSTTTPHGTSTINGESVLFLLKNILYTNSTGTPPVDRTGLSMKPLTGRDTDCLIIPSKNAKIVGKINNISDAIEVLALLIEIIPINEFEEFKPPLKKIGDLIIYGKDTEGNYRDMEFRKTTVPTPSMGTRPQPSMGTRPQPSMGTIPQQSMGTIPQQSMGVKLPGHIPREATAFTRSFVPKKSSFYGGGKKSRKRNI